ncbi:DUF4870 domain-containing protein [Actinomadura bangladeshensis]|uniref:DUF4870 domain-containing protein n=1 Tax=Actinomadura bangladeshensis TaxID=453573 RepID=A0A4R4NZF8_9ACTN|nr:DUF4870 domain-containing protein [Actinomadura bangladeshensis]TDC12962.1 DUF4870 domain-containing protein [Actinomadura bangladeshensis]
MAYGPPPPPGQGQQPGWQAQPQQQSPWQQPGNMWQQPQQQPEAAWQQPQQPQQPQQQGGGTSQMPGHYGPVSDDDRTWSLMAYVGQFLVGAVAPAIVYFGKAGSPFVRRHAAQGLNMGIAAIAVWFVFGLLSLAVEVLVWVPLLFTAAVMFFLVYAGRAANRGEFRRVPAVVAWPILK